MHTYYLMKVKGKAKIPDYIQLRDADFTLIGYFRPGRDERLNKVVKNDAHAEELLRIIGGIEAYGQLMRVDI
ncbi:MAG: fructose-6-phosphate aldolase [Bacteroidia bacterium]|jgi:hypothetical protein|nr:fructose-6-phosphate aldolase [Bacteroidia bacterium]